MSIKRNFIANGLLVEKILRQNNAVPITEMAINIIMGVEIVI
jgi:hypothetical protein